MTAAGEDHGGAHALVKELIAGGRDRRSSLAALRADTRLPRAEMAAAALDIGVRDQRKDPRLAFSLAAQANRWSREAGDPARSALAHSAAGQALILLGLMRRAERLLRQASVRYLEIDAPVNAAHQRVMSIRPLMSLGRYPEAREAGEEADRIFEAEQDETHRVALHAALGDIAHRQDRLRDALRHYRRALGGMDRASGRLGIPITELNIANCLAALHRPRAAGRYFKRARVAFREKGLFAEAAAVDHNEGVAALIRGRFAQAGRLFDAAAAAHEALADDNRLGLVNLDRADLYLQMGMLSEARRCARAAVRELTDQEMAKERAEALFFEAVATLLDGRPDAAEVGFTAARAGFETEENRAWQAQCDLLCATAASEQGRVESARNLARGALACAIRDGLPDRAASSALLLARLDLADGDPEGALEKLDRAERSAGGLETPWLDVELCRYRGLATLACGDERAGVEFLLRAVDVLERHRGRVPADEFMVSFLASKAALYAETVDALVALGEDALAFEYSERARSRALADMLQARGADPAGPASREPSGVDRRLEHLQSELGSAYSRLHESRTNPDGEDLEGRMELRRVVKALEVQLAARLREARARSAAGTGHAVDEAVGLGEAQALLDDDTTLVEYFATPRGLHAFIVGKDRFERRDLSVPVGTVASAARRFRFHMADRAAGEAAAAEAGLAARAARANLARLCDWLVLPIENALTTRRLVIVPHGPIHGLPFHAFPLGEAPLCERFDVAYAPSASVYALLAAGRDRATGAPAVFGLPDAAAPLIEKEARSVAAALGPDAAFLLGADATWERLALHARSSRVLHVATHAQFRRSAPMLSSLRLADRWVNLYDLYGLDVRADLVVLSACETGVAQVSLADELTGLVRGLVCAGACRMLVSQWQVDDESTVRLMTAFYGALRGGEPYAAAMRSAMAEVRADFEHPYYWAPFFLVGFSDRPRVA